MIDLKGYDFSKESKIKDKLFEKMMLVYEKSKGKAMMLSEDDLDLVSAAVGNLNDASCPFIDKKCCDCENYSHIESHCKHHYTK